LPKDHRDAPKSPAADADDKLAKASEKIKKLRVDRIGLKRQLSRTEWLKAFTAPVAFVAIVVSGVLTYQQIEQTQNARDDERFDKALTRLTSNNPNQRIMGVASLRLFLTANYKAKHYDTLYFLIGHTILEQDATVRETMLDTFTAKLQSVDRKTLSQVLDATIERNGRLAYDLKRLNDRRWSATATRESVPADSSTGLRRPKAYHLPFSLLNTDEIRPLYDTAGILQDLVRAGATSTDFAGVFCRACDFSHARLTGAQFYSSYLQDTDFSYADLRNANFNSAELSLANFFHADLRNANLSNQSIDRDLGFPELECADLRGTDLSNRTLVRLESSITVRHDRDYRNYRLECPQLRYAHIDKSTKMSPLGITFSYDREIQKIQGTIQWMKLFSSPCSDFWYRACTAEMGLIMNVMVENGCGRR